MLLASWQVWSNTYVFNKLELKAAYSHQVIVFHRKENLSGKPTELLPAGFQAKLVYSKVSSTTVEGTKAGHSQYIFARIGRARAV